MLEDPAVAELLDLDISAGIPLMGYFPGGVRLFFLLNRLNDLLERPYEFRVLLYHMHLYGSVCIDDCSGLANASFCQAELPRTRQ